MTTKMSFFQRQLEYSPQFIPPLALNSPGKENSSSHSQGLLCGQINDHEVFALCCSESGLSVLPPFSRNKSTFSERNTLKYSTRPRQVMWFPLISLTSRFSGLRSQGIKIFKFLMNSSSISGKKKEIKRHHRVPE